MKPKVIKNEAEYEAALAHVAELMDAAPGSPEEEELELFALLVEQYEQEHYPIALPDPVDAILFRMEQQGLTRSDLAQYIGSPSKVSEVLNRKRPLSLAMMRALHEGLGIPAEVLLQQPGKELPPPLYDPRDYPVSEMLKCNYFGERSETSRIAKYDAEALLAGLFAPFRGNLPQPIYCRHTGRETDPRALLAWQARVVNLIQDTTLPPYEPDRLDDTFFGRVIGLSCHSEGPRLVQEVLNKRGIHFVILPHLSKTHLDGACFLSPAGSPVIALTLRYDRLDNFWYTLTHELGHLKLHIHQGGIAFFDDTEHDACEDDDPREAEANAFAREKLIPQAIWQQAGGGLLTCRDDREIRALAERLGICPAIVAGRVRWETQNYAICSDLVGNRQVRRLFPDCCPQP